MLITVSGMVGSGKSTTAASVVDLLATAGLKPRYLRFRYLQLFGFRRIARSRPTSVGTDREVQQRGTGFALRRLTAILTAGYAVRVVAFWFSGIGRASRCDVLDRYFYDSFVHYELTSVRERLYMGLLRRLMPRPDLAILLVASDSTILTRRGNYAVEYVGTIGRRYADLRTFFPNLICVSTDPHRMADAETRRIVQTLIDGGAKQTSSEFKTARSR